MKYVILVCGTKLPKLDGSELRSHIIRDLNPKIYF